MDGLRPLESNAAFRAVCSLTSWVMTCSWRRAPFAARLWPWLWPWLWPRLWP